MTFFVLNFLISSIRLVRRYLPCWKLPNSKCIVPQQTGLSYFYMVKSDKGWKILPDQVDENESHSGMPESIQKRE